MGYVQVGAFSPTTEVRGVSPLLWSCWCWEVSSWIFGLWKNVQFFRAMQITQQCLPFVDPLEVSPGFRGLVEAADVSGWMWKQRC